MSTQVNIGGLRRRANKLELRVEKSRVRNTRYNNQGGYMLINWRHNTVVDGANYDLELEDLERAIARREAAR
jgi:hypothetical protein